MHTIHEVGMLSAKMDLLMKKTEEGSNSKKDPNAVGVVSQDYKPH